MTNDFGQVALDQSRIANFYHDLFVQSQAKDFAELCGPGLDRRKIVSDMGGGCGFFAEAIRRDLGIPVRVVDADPVSVATSSAAGLEAVEGDALSWQPKGDESIACFNLILHHLVGRGEQATRHLQMKALDQWKHSGAQLFVNEYIYDSYIANSSGSLIYWITASRTLSALAMFIARFVPSLRANTFGVGVRFRSENEWREMFQAQGWKVVGYSRGREEGVSLPRRILLIKSCRRDSFLLARI